MYQTVKLDLNNRVIIIGGSSKIGKALAAKFKVSGLDFYTTTRNKKIANNEIYFDLLKKNYDSLLQVFPSIVFLCAGVSSIEACQRDPLLSRQINVNCVVTLVDELIKRNIFVIYLSSSTVFNGELPWPNEEAALTPIIEYGIQKADTERQLLNIPNSKNLLAIVRMSKVFTNSAQTIENLFFLDLKNNKKVNPFEDLFIAPVSENYVVESLFQILNKRLPGIYHLSNEAAISYARLCYLLAQKYEFEQDIIKPIKIIDSGANILFNPRYPGLGMDNTMKVLKIFPEKTNEMLNFFDRR